MHQQNRGTVADGLTYVVTVDRWSFYRGVLVPFKVRRQVVLLQRCVSTIYSKVCRQVVLLQRCASSIKVRRQVVLLQRCASSIKVHGRPMEFPIVVPMQCKRLHCSPFYTHRRCTSHSRSTHIGGVHCTAAVHT